MKEQGAYSGLYPLYGFVPVGGKQCAIEYPNEKESDGPVFEVMAPDGFHFIGEELHTLLCFDMEDLKTRITYGLEPCGPQCAEQGKVEVTA